MMHIVTLAAYDVFILIAKHTLLFIAEIHPYSRSDWADMQGAARGQGEGGLEEWSKRGQGKGGMEARSVRHNLICWLGTHRSSH